MKEEKNKERKEKKTKKKDKVKESEDPPKTNKAAKQERKSNFIFLDYIKALQFVVLVSFKYYCFLFVVSIAEKNLTEVETEAEDPKMNKENESDREEEDGSNRPVPQSPKRRKQLDTCES